MQLAGSNTYSGGTVVSAGVLSVSGAGARLGTGNVTVQGTAAGTVLAIESGVSNAIDDGATLNLSGGGAVGLAEQGYADLGGGVVESVRALSLNGVLQPVGTYGATGSGAGNVLDEYFAGAGILSVVALAGDYNVDGSVDSADYLSWRANVGQPAGTLLNDNTGAVVGVNQYNLWRANFGNQLGSGSGSGLDGSAVPEPSSSSLLMLGLAALVGRRRGR
jgi:autotransporter-associated beta strand protein